MRTMTCSQLGGACEQAHVGADANQIITAQDRHLCARWSPPAASSTNWPGAT